MDFVERVRIIEQDHEPDGWPAIQTHELRAAANEIQRLREELAKREWQPIETAPKDGTDVLIVTWHDGEPDIQSSWYNSTGMWWAGVGGDSPTHWMPLPAPPKEDA